MQSFEQFCLASLDFHQENKLIKKMDSNFALSSELLNKFFHQEYPKSSIVDDQDTEAEDDNIIILYDDDLKAEAERRLSTDCDYSSKRSGEIILWNHDFSLDSSFKGLSWSMSSDDLACHTISTSCQAVASFQLNY